MATFRRRTDLLALSHLRNDGRKPSEIRRMRIQMGPLASTGVAGSAMIEMGLTSVMASVLGPMEQPRWSDARSDRAVVSVTVRNAPFASADRRVTNPSSDRRLVEQANLVQKALEGTLLLHLHPRSKIEIDLTILSNDGGALCACINASTVALIDAGIPMVDMLSSCSAGLSDDKDIVLVDLSREEMRTAGGETAVYLPCAVLPQRGTVVLAQCESRMPASSFHKVLQAAIEGCEAVFQVMQAAVRERGSILLSAKSGRGSIMTEVEG